MARPSSSQRLQAFHRIRDPFRGGFQAVVGEAGLNEKLADGALVHVEVQQVAEAHALSGNVASVVPKARGSAAAFCAKDSVSS